jgi:mannose-6-phosphate isomerase-like protein (cupin superfamily)
MLLRSLVLPVAVSGALALGYVGGRFAAPTPAGAQAAPLVASSVNVISLTGDAVGPLLKSGIRSKTLVAADGMTIALQENSPAKHFHKDANEVQYILDGTGTVWLGDKQIPFKAGDLIVIPKGLAHAGAIMTSGTYRALAIKTPPQDPADTHYL